MIRVLSVGMVVLLAAVAVLPLIALYATDQRLVPTGLTALRTKANSAQVQYCKMNAKICYEGRDRDGDGLPNGKIDTDEDDDGFWDTIDFDIDGDGIDNRYDSDVDGDGIPNKYDYDIDGDGVPNKKDLTPYGPGGPKKRRR